MFRTVKTIGLLSVGLLAMLGTKAEAHYMYVHGKWVYHSIGCQATIGSLLDPPGPLVEECVVNTAMVETRCSDRSIVIFPIEVTLVAEVLIPPGQPQAEVVVSDDPLLDVNLNPACGDSTPTDVLILNMNSTISIFQCVGPVVAPCSVRLLTSTAAAQCELPAQFNLDNYPENLPPDGTPYTCTDPTNSLLPPVVLHIN
jgi:hypothetical protein